MTNDELHDQIVTVKGLVLTLADRFNRMEKSIDSIVPIDRAVAEQKVRYENQQSEIRDLEHDIKNCKQAHGLKSELMMGRIEKLETNSSKTAGALTAMKFFSGAASLLLITCGAWVYDRAENNRDMNYVQQHEIAWLKERVKTLEGQPK